MIIYDRIYGEIAVDKVLEELILSKPIQRLKEIHQGGASFLVNEKWNEKRFDHSIGTMLLIRMLGGSIEEQIAGLLHDVSHTAFSHVVDFVFENKQEDYHEKIYSSVIENSEIPQILAKYKYNFKEILFDDSKWTLLEQPAPQICADRVDSTLRDMYAYGNISLEGINNFLDNLIVVKGKMYLKNIETAEWFVETYYKEVIDFFLDPLNVYGYEMLAKTLKLSLEKNIITPNDFLLKDNELLSKIKSSGNKEVFELLKKIHPNVQVKEDHVNYTLHRKSKLRLIDPSILIDGVLIPSSRLSKKVEIMGHVAYEKAARGMYVKVLSN